MENNLTEKFIKYRKRKRSNGFTPYKGAEQKKSYEAQKERQRNDYNDPKKITESIEELINLLESYTNKKVIILE